MNLETGAQTFLLAIGLAAGIHHGGRLAFGRDGMLYVTVGDHGPQRDPHGRAQDLGSLGGKVLRLDTRTPGVLRVPPDNPFVGRAGARPEIWAYGFRNPWGLAFDTQGRGYVSDAGFHTREEINRLVRGGNYGWPFKEGSAWVVPVPTIAPTFVEPIYEYDTGVFPELGVAERTGEGSVVIGGAPLPVDERRYLFGDFSGVLMELDTRTGQLAFIGRLPAGRLIRAFSRTNDGQVYMLTARSPSPSAPGTVYRWTAQWR